MQTLRVLAAAFLTCAIGTAGTQARQPQLSPGEQCAAAIQSAQAREKIPGGRLAAIGRVESGRRDPASGRWLPWPWTVDVGGKGMFFDSAAEAIAAVQSLQAQGIRTIDVGCVQVDLAWHPNAFTTLDQAFDPATNVAYGAHFLTQLFAATGDWDRAVGYYHSTTPELAADYESKVLGIHDAALAAAAKVPPPRTPLQQLAAAWSATLGSAASSNTVAFKALPGRLPQVDTAPEEVAEAPLEPRAHAVGHAGLKGRRATSP
jgi:hypothetical protein